MLDEALRKYLKNRLVATGDVKHICLQENSERCLGKNDFYM